MPKLIITIEEQTLDHPDGPDAKMLGFGISANLEIAETDIGKETVLTKLAPLFLTAISEVLNEKIGNPLYHFQGSVGDTFEYALQKAMADAFPDSIEIVNELIN